MQLSEFYRQYPMERKIVLSKSREIVKRETELCNRMGVAAANVGISSIPEWANQLIEGERQGEETPSELAGVQSQMCIMISVVYMLIDTGKLKYFKKEMIDAGTIAQLVEDVNVFLKEGGNGKDMLDLGEKVQDFFIIADEYDKAILDKNYYSTHHAIKDAADKVAKMNHVLDAEVVAIYEDCYDELAFFERAFIDCLETKIPVVKLKCLTQEENAEARRQYFQVFGLNNEIHAVVKDVLQKGYPWEQVQVICATSANNYAMMAYLKEIGVPYHMPEGISEDYSFEASVIKEILEYKRYFDIREDYTINAKDAFKVVMQKMEELTQNVNYPPQLKAKLIVKIRLAQKCAEDSDYEASFDLVRKMIYRMLLSGRIKEETKEDCAMYISSLNATAAIFRPYVYMIGFESKNYPGAVKQSPILLDEEKRSLYGEAIAQKYVSRHKIDELDKKMERLIHAPHEELTLSYVSFDTVNMREQNPSAFYQKEMMEHAGANLEFGFRENQEKNIIDLREWILK